MPSETFLLDTFAVTAGDIANADVRSLVALSVSVGWSHRAEDWDFMREVGQGRVALDESGRVHGAAMWFPFGDRHATIGMVITTPRLQAHGGAQWLMRDVLEQTQGRTLGLHATRQSHRLFLSLGFSDEENVCQYEGVVGALPGAAHPSDGELREFDPSDVARLKELDRAVTGWERDALIDVLAARSRGMVLCRNGEVDACALIRPFGRGAVIGPTIARNEADALAVLRCLIAEKQGSFVRIDLREENGPLTDLAKKIGLRADHKVTRMSLGERWPFSAGSVWSQWSIASQATG